MPDIRLLEAPAPPSPHIAERAFQDLILDLAGRFGWTPYHTYDARRSQAGFPDLVLARPPVVLFRELKVGSNTLTLAQREWGALLTACGCDWRVWRPQSWSEVVATLTREERTLG